MSRETNALSSAWSMALDAYQVPGRTMANEPPGHWHGFCVEAAVAEVSLELRREAKNMPALSLRQAAVQKQQQDQRHTFGQFVKIEHSEWLEPENEKLASTLQEERNRNEFLEAREDTRVSQTSRVQWRRREGYGSSAGTPRVELTERHHAWLENQPPTQAPEALLRDQLLDQLRDARLDHNDLDSAFGEFLIGHLDRFGLLSMTLEDLVRSFQEVGGRCSEKDVRKTLQYIQRFDPPGIAAQDEAERLDLILDRVADDHSIADEFHPPLRHIPELRKIPRHFAFLKSREFDELARHLGVNADVLSEALDELRRILRRFNAFDGYSKASDPLMPDIVFSLTAQGQIAYRITVARGAHVCVPRVYESVAVPRSSAEAFNKAQVLVSAISGRYEMLDSIAQTLISLQGGFIRHGKEHLRPLLQKTLAKKIGKDDSTVSRVLHGKRIETPHGTYAIKVCFPKEVIAGSGVTEEQLKVILAAVLVREPMDSPWDDDRIASEIAELCRLGLARRTVQKYRKKFGIGTSRERRQPLVKRSA